MSISDILEELDLQFRRVDAILPEIDRKESFKVNDLNDTEIVKTIDSFIFRFIKIQDKMGEKLFPIFLRSLQEYKPNMPLIDVLNTLERIEIIDSAEEWIEFRKIRNSLTHEYPGNENEIIEAITLAVSAYKKIKLIYLSIKTDVSNRKI